MDLGLVLAMHRKKERMITYAQTISLFCVLQLMFTSLFEREGEKEKLAEERHKPKKKKKKLPLNSVLVRWPPVLSKVLFVHPIELIRRTTKKCPSV